MIPHLALMIDERYFPRGKEFIPERWTEQWAEGVRERRAYIPFGYGVHSCVGKQLALNEMRFAFASVLREWDFVLG
jgi:cytochrome P450